MTNLTMLTDAETAEVSGGTVAITQAISITATQTGISSVSEVESVSNSGRVTATVSGTGTVSAVSGAFASNIAVVSQANVVALLANLRIGPC
jgi:hypothetical protein